MAVVALVSLLREVHVAPIQALYGAVEWWLAPWSKVPPLGLAFLPFFAICWVGMIVVHECGHLVGARIVGWKPLSIQAAGVLLDRTHERWRFTFSAKAIPLGLVNVAPESAIAFSRKLRMFALAGPTANVIVAIALRAVCVSTQGYVREALIECASLSLLMGGINILPVRMNQVETDGYVALRGSRNPGWVQARIAAALVRNALCNGTPIERCNDRWFSKTRPTGKPYLQQLAPTLQHYVRFEYKEQHADAAQMLERALTLASRGGPKTRAMLLLLAAMFQAEVRRDLDRANTWKAMIPERWLEPYQKTLLEASFAFCTGERDRFLALRQKSLEEYKEQPDTPLRAATIARWEEYTQRMLKRLEPSHAESAAASS
jgi:hypothetical protein